MAIENRNLETGTKLVAKFKKVEYRAEVVAERMHISTRHLAKYLREREFHWNRRKATDGERTVDAIQGAKGKRLMYHRPTLGR